MKTIHLSIIFLLLLVACNNSPKLKYCENEYLLFHNDTLNSITLNFGQNEVDFEKQLVKQLKVDSICGGSGLLGLSLDLYTSDFHESSDSIIVPVEFYNSCRDNYIIFCGIRPNISMFINAYNEILVCGNYLETNTDSIVNALQECWERRIDFSENNGIRFVISLQPEANNQTIETVRKAYAQFYRKKAAEYCQEKYNVALCNADKTIIYEFIEKVPFKLHICFTWDCSFLPLPPPPPPL